MKIAVLSGKGGTGKTTVAASLASVIENCQYVDCDVEEPNGAVFIKPDLKRRYDVEVLVPQVNEQNCDGCGKCAETCQFNAIAVVKGKVLIFPEICHHCGACVLACPNSAIEEKKRTIGIIETDEQEKFIQGKLNIGEPISIPIITDIKNRLNSDVPTIIDCSPGASCVVVNSIEGCDYCILVTEPTPFGLHDLKIAVQLVEKMGIPYGVVINKADQKDESIHSFCKQKDIKILMEIPFSKETAQMYSKGILPVESDKRWAKKFKELFDSVKEGVSGETDSIY
ncbi:MAG: ATP-binding protein [Clostridia bacterium]|nr:ATP-binding protein [Clostridia bacterium]